MSGVLWLGEEAHDRVRHFVLSQTIQTIEQRQEKGEVIRMEGNKQVNKKRNS